MVVTQLQLNIIQWRNAWGIFLTLQSKLVLKQLNQRFSVFQKLPKKSPKDTISALGILLLLKTVSNYFSITIHKRRNIHRFLSLELYSVNLKDFFICADDSVSVFWEFDELSFPHLWISSPKGRRGLHYVLEFWSLLLLPLGEGWGEGFRDI